MAPPHTPAPRAILHGVRDGGFHRGNASELPVPAAGGHPPRAYLCRAGFRRWRCIPKLTRGWWRRSASPSRHRIKGSCTLQCWLCAANVNCMHCTEIMDSVRFIFPPCREAAVWHCGGSGEGWCDGLCEEHAFDMHCMPLCESGTAGLRPALTPSYADPFKLVIRGFGRCVSTPQLLVLPVPVALAVVTVAQTIAFRKGDLKVVHVVSITTMTTGLNESHSVILDEMKLLRTVPWTGKNVRELSTCASLHVSLKYACAMA